MSKPIEFWVAIAVGAAIVYERSAEKPRFARILASAISAGGAFALAPDVAAWTGRSETLVGMGIAAFGYAMIDGAMALVGDRKLLREIVLRRLGGSSNDPQ